MRKAVLALALVACAMLVACGKKNAAPSSASAAQAADVNAASPLEKPYRYKGGAELDVDRLFAIIPAYARPRYQKSEFDRALGATIVTGLVFGDEEGEGAFTAERAEFYGVDLAAVDRIKGADAGAPDAPFEPVFEKVRLFGLKSVAGPTDPPSSTTIGALEIDRLRVRRGGIPDDPPGSGIATFFNAFDMAGLYFKDVAVTQGEGGRAPEVATEFRAGDLRLVGVGGGRLGALVARDLDYRISQSAAALAEAASGVGPAGGLLLRGPLRNFLVPENQRTRVKSVEWRDVTFEGWMKYALKGERPPISDLKLIDLGTARMLGAETFVEDRRVSVTPETEISAMTFAWLWPSKIRVVTRGGEHDFTAYLPRTERAAIAELKAIKLDRVKGDSDFAYDWNPERGGAAMSTGFNSAGFADLNIDVAVEGLELAKVNAARAAGAGAPVADLARLKSLSIVIDDDAMLDAFYRMAALQSGGDADDMREATPAMLRLGKAELQRNAPRLAGYLDAIADFLEEGGTLTIKAAPESPVPLAAIRAAALGGGPEAAAEAVNLTVTQKP